MDTKEFLKVVKQRHETMLETLGMKGAEYARGDRLSHFKKVAAFRHQTPEEALMGMMMKHWASIDDMITDLSRSIMHPKARWQEKIGDSVNYLVLLEALLEERYAAADNLQ